MKKLLLLALIVAFISCDAQKKICPAYRSDKIIITKKYIGNFIDYRHTGPDICGNTDLIWIRTTMSNSFGKISAYGKTCDFKPGDRVYLNSTYSVGRTPGNWQYVIGNDSSVSYRVSEFRYENKNFITAWAQ